MILVLVMVLSYLSLCICLHDAGAKYLIQYKSYCYDFTPLVVPDQNSHNAMNSLYWYMIYRIQCESVSVSCKHTPETAKNHTGTVPNNNNNNNNNNYYY